MKKILNKKGFTLVELLAVIIVLSIVMIIATRSIISEMNKANGKSAIVQGEALRREVNNACMLNGTVTAGEIDELVKGDKIFSASTSELKITDSKKGFTIGLTGTKFSTVIAPAQTDTDNVRILVGTTTVTDRSTVENGRLYIGIDCKIEE